MIDDFEARENQPSAQSVDQRKIAGACRNVYNFTTTFDGLVPSTSL